MESEKMWDDESSESEEMDFPAHLKHSDLLEITKSYRDNLEGSGMEYIRALSSAFWRDNLINSEEYETVEMLLAESRRNEACDLLFDKVITSADDEVLKAWKILERHQKLTATVNAEIERTGDVQGNDATTAPSIDLATDMKLGQKGQRSPDSQSRHPVENLKPNVAQEDMSASNTLDSSPASEQFDFPKVNTLKRKFDKAEKVQTGNFRVSGAPTTPVKDIVTEMNLGQNRRWQNYRQIWNPVETVKSNVDQEDKSASNITKHTLDSNPDSEDFSIPNVAMLKKKFDNAEKGRNSGKTSRKTTKGHGTEIKAQYLIETESDRHKLEHTERKRHTIDNTKTRTVDAETNFPSVFGGIPRKTSTKLGIHTKSLLSSWRRSLERLHGGIEEDNPDRVETILSEDDHRDGNKSEKNVMDEASTHTATSLQEEETSPYDLGRTTEALFATSVKPTTELVRERREQHLSENESHRNKPQMTEPEEDNRCQPKSNFVKNKYGAGNKLESNVTEVTSKDPTAAQQEGKSGHGEVTGGVFGNAVKPTSELVRERKEQLLRDNEPQRNRLQMAEPEEDNRHKANRKSVKKKNKLEKKDMKITSKDPAATAEEKKAGHAGATGGKVTEDRLDNLIRTLARYTDIHLYRVTKNHHEQLESAIIDRVEMISESLLRERWMTELDHEEMRALIRNRQRLDVSQQLLTLVLDRDIGDCRTFWNVLSKMQVNQQTLIKLLTQDVGKDAKRLHRNYLRSQSMKLNMRLISDIYVDPTINLIQREFESFTGESNKLIREVETHEIFKKSHRNSDKTTISLVYGAAGTGKTTLIQKIIYDWATELKYDDFSFVLHFKIQKLNEVKGKTTLKALILETYPYLETYLDHLMKKPKRLLLIFDDFDRLHRSFLVSNNVRDSDPRCRCIDAEAEYFVCDILRGLLQGYLLKGCSVLITTRVLKLEALGHLTVDSTFQIIGFTSEKVKEYFSRYLRHKQYASGILQLIKQSDILRNMCCDPLFCSILTSSLVPAPAEREEKIELPTGSHTQVLSGYVAHLLAECGCDDKTIQKSLREVGQLAYKEIEQSTHWLDDDGLSQLNSCPPVFISALTFQGPEKQRRGVTYEFRHSALRDFLAALTNILNSPVVRLKGLLDEIFQDTDERFSTFTLFLVGLSSRRSVDCLEMEVGAIPTEVASCISEWFRKSVTRRLSKMDGKKAQSLFLHKLYCLLEFGDNQLLTEVLDSFRTIKLNKLILKPLDCTVLSETLIHSEEIEELDLSSCLVNLERIERLELVMHSCVILRLNQNNLQDSGVKRLFNILKQIDCKIQTLELKSNHLTDDCLEMLFCTLSTNDSLKQLNLSNSSLDAEHANRFSDEIIQNLVDSCAQQKEIRWLRKEYIAQGIATSGILTLITE